MTNTILRSFTRSALPLCAVALLSNACASGSAGTGATSSQAPRPQGRTDAAVQTAVQNERNVQGTTNANAIAVPPFRIARSDTTLEPLAYALADLLTTDLSLSRQLTLVERTRLGDVLRELQLTASGRVDSATAPRVGRIISARRLVLGGIDSVPRSSDVRIGVRLANVQSGQVERSIDARAPLNNILQAEKTLVFRVFEELGVTLTPAERAVIEQRPTANLQALLAYGRGARFQLLGDYQSAAREFRRAQQLDPNFRDAGTRADATTTLAATGGATETPTPTSGSTGSATSGSATGDAGNPPTTGGAASNPPGSNPSTTTSSTSTSNNTDATPSKPTLSVPSVHPGGTGVTTVVDRINRPLDVFTSVTRPSGSAADPSFPSTAVTVIITVVRP